MLLDEGQVAVGDLTKVSCIKVGIGNLALLILDLLQSLFKAAVWYLHDHVAKHLDKAAVAVQDETLVTGLLNHASHCIRVEAKVEDGVHHAGHRAGCTTANRDE